MPDRRTADPRHDSDPDEPPADEVVRVADDMLRRLSACDDAQRIIATAAVPTCYMDSAGNIHEIDEEPAWAVIHDAVPHLASDRLTLMDAAHHWGVDMESMSDPPWPDRPGLWVRRWIERVRIMRDCARWERNPHRPVAMDGRDPADPADVEAVCASLLIGLWRRRKFPWFHEVGCETDEFVRLCQRGERYRATGDAIAPLLGFAYAVAERQGRDTDALIPLSEFVRRSVAPDAKLEPGLDLLRQMQKKAALEQLAAPWRIAGAGADRRPTAGAASSGESVERDPMPGDDDDGPFRVGTRTVFRWSGRTVKLPPRAWGMADYLWGQPGRSAEREAVVDAVWGHDSGASDNAVTKAVQAFNDALLEAGLIAPPTMHSGGGRIVVEVPSRPAVADAGTPEVRKSA